MYAIGQKFSKLLIIKNRQIVRSRGFYLCRCDCGTEKLIRSDKFKTLSKMKIISCGCHRGKKEKGIAAFNMCLKTYKARAKGQQLDFLLTRDQFKYLVTQDCFYCSSPPQNKSGHKQNNGFFMYNGLDRIDNKQGYNIDNVVACCKICNIAKNNHTQAEFYAWVLRAYKTIKDKIL